MAEKLRFKPVITRIKLNPEQAVLACACYRGITWARDKARTPFTFCSARTRTIITSYSTTGTGASIS
jgi:hypothetical protein